jgi:3-deoxy-7-phosphoheptulonate synthase
MKTELSTLDTTRIDDTRIGAVRPLITPALAGGCDCLCPKTRQTLVEQSRTAISQNAARPGRPADGGGGALLHPRPRPGYRLRLPAQSRRPTRSGELLVVMRVYFEKPRTTVGWKGYINDPHLDGSFRHQPRTGDGAQAPAGRAGLGMPVGTEFLDLLSPQFISDLVSWGAIGARTTESQSHRQLASGLSCPVGFKNGTDGGIKVATDAIQAAKAPHAFMGMTKMGQAAMFETRGNDDCHVILRGGKAAQLFAKGRRGRGLRPAEGRGPARAGDDRRVSTPTAASSTRARSWWPPTWPPRLPRATRASPAS